MKPPAVTRHLWYAAAWRSADRRPATEAEIRELTDHFGLRGLEVLGFPGIFQARIPLDWKRDAERGGSALRVALVRGVCFTVRVDTA